MDHTVRKSIIKCLLLLGLSCCMVRGAVSGVTSVKNSSTKQGKIDLNKKKIGQKVREEIRRAMNAVEHLYVEPSKRNTGNDVKFFSRFLCTVYAKKFDKPLDDTINVKDLERAFSEFFRKGHTKKLDALLRTIGYTKEQLTPGNRTMYVHYNTSNPEKNERSVHGASIFIKTAPKGLTFFYGVKDWMKEKLGSDGKFASEHIRNGCKGKDRINSRDMQSRSLEFQNDCFDYVKTNRLKKFEKHNSCRVDRVK